MATRAHSSIFKVDDGNESRSKKFCTHCNLSGHWVDKCWKLHLEMGPKKVKQGMQEPLKQIKTTYAEKDSKGILGNKILPNGEE